MIVSQLPGQGFVNLVAHVDKLTPFENHRQKSEKRLVCCHKDWYLDSKESRSPTNKALIYLQIDFVRFYQEMNLFDMMKICSDKDTALAFLFAKNLLLKEVNCEGCPYVMKLQNKSQMTDEKNQLKIVKNSLKKYNDDVERRVYIFHLAMAYMRKDFVKPVYGSD
uniref:Uncharacterized protein n=1 Tax=Romanomermis culicivorax TaxID=13658 RepID=A0A915K4P5_ROMCU